MLLIYLVIFIWIAMVRGPRMFGGHLWPIEGHKNWLRRELYIYWFSAIQFREVYSIHIGVEAKHQLLSFMIRKEQFYHRFLKRVGLAHEVLISDSDFDHKYFITTDAPDHLEAILKSGQLLSILKSLMAKNVRAIHVAGQRVWCVLAEADFKKSTSQLYEYYDLLNSIAKSVQLKKSKFSYSFNLFLVSCFLVLHMTLFLNGMLSIIPQLDSPDTISSMNLIGFGVIVGVIFILFWHFLIIFLFRKSSWIGWVMADFWIFGVFGIIVGGITFSHQFNQTLSQPEPIAKIERVNRKECVLVCIKDCGHRCTNVQRFRYAGDASCAPEHLQVVYDYQLKNNPLCQERTRFEYEILVTSWHKDEENLQTYRTQVLPEVFNKIREKGNVVIPVNAGALGFEWVDYRMIRPAP